jgi:hypothetical protein
MPPPSTATSTSGSPSTGADASGGALVSQYDPAGGNPIDLRYPLHHAVSAQIPQTRAALDMTALPTLG